MLCPMRKTIDWKIVKSQGMTAIETTSEEYFKECVKGKCMAYEVSEYGKLDCLLMRRKL